MPYPLLEQAIAYIGRHAVLPDKDHLIRFCRKEIEGRRQLGLVTGEERDRLLGILRGECLEFAACG